MDPLRFQQELVAVGGSSASATKEAVRLNRSWNNVVRVNVIAASIHGVPLVGAIPTHPYLTIRLSPNPFRVVSRAGQPAGILVPITGTDTTFTFPSDTSVLDATRPHEFGDWEVSIVDKDGVPTTDYTYWTLMLQVITDRTMKNV